MRSFPALHFDVIKMSLASRVEHQEALSFAFIGEKCILITIIVATDCFYLCGVNFDDVCSIPEQCNSTRKGWVLFQSVF